MRQRPSVATVITPALASAAAVGQIGAPVRAAGIVAEEGVAGAADASVAGSEAEASAGNALNSKRSIEFSAAEC